MLFRTIRRCGNAFASRYAEVREYLSLLGWDLRKDNFNGYFYVINTDDANRCQLGKMERE